MKNIAVVILNYNTFDDTVVCVDSIKKFTEGVAYKIFIVDNASPDKSGVKLADQYRDDPHVKVLQSEENKGFSGGNNIGIRAALQEKFEYIYVLNSDIILENDAFSLMQEQFEANENVAIVGPSIVNSIGEYAQFARPGVTLLTYYTGRRLWFKLCPKLGRTLRYYQFAQDQDFAFDGMLNGCCFGIKADFVREHNCLDENVFMYYEEDILAHIMKKAKKQALIVSKAKIIHNEGVATKKSSTDKMLFTRFYRWTSVLYVLKNYTKLNQFVCKLLSLQNIGNWMVMSLYNKKYRESFRAFVAENKRVLGTRRR